MSRAAFYYFAEKVLDNDRRPKKRDTRLVTQRARVRKILNPATVPSREFRKIYRLSKSAYKYLCNELRTKTNLKSSKRVSLERKVLCALLFYASGSYQRITGLANHVGQATVSAIIQEVTQALNHPNIKNKFIKFPTSRAKRNLIKQKFLHKYGFPGVCGAVDGSLFHVVHPIQEIEQHFYCRKHFHALNVSVICDSDNRITYINTKNGGSYHDAFVWNYSWLSKYMQDLHEIHKEEVWLLGDSGYPLRPWLITPFKKPPERSPESQYNKIHDKARVVIENTFALLKNRWRCLNKDRTLHYTPNKCSRIISACCVLHNLMLKFPVNSPPKKSTTRFFETAWNNTRILTSSVISINDHLKRGKAIRAILMDRFRRL